MSAPIAPILAHQRHQPSRTWSLIITIYGDAIVPRGGLVWLGTLLTFFEAMGIEGGVVRTAMSRLAADEWLERVKVGRNSFYRLRMKGLAPFEAASQRIYSAQPEPWRGFFELLLPDENDRAMMLQAGCGALAPGVWLSPRPIPIEGLRLRADGDARTLGALATRIWPLERIAASYSRFVATFSPLRDFLKGRGTLSPVDAMIARVLLIHEYRRIVLRDPLLPASVLPESWPGHTSRRLCSDIYRSLLHQSERWLDENATDENGAALVRNPLVFQRFADRKTEPGCER